jgi:hypothetical protein
MERQTLLRQVQLAKIRDQLFVYIAEKDGFLDADMAERIQHLMRSYDYIESLFKQHASVRR